jgi:hypothetical protein
VCEANPKKEKIRERYGKEGKKNTCIEEEEVCAQRRSQEGHVASARSTVRFPGFPRLSKFPRFRISKTWKCPSSSSGVRTIDSFQDIPHRILSVCVYRRSMRAAPQPRKTRHVHQPEQDRRFGSRVPEISSFRESKT